MGRGEVTLDPSRSAAHRFGFELRSWRKTRDLTLAQLGAKVHVGDDLVRMIETAQRRPSREFAQRCDSALDSCGLFLRLWEAVEAEQLTDNASGITDNHGVGTPAVLTAAVPHGIIDPMERRSFLGTLVAAPAVGILAPASVVDGSSADIVTVSNTLRSALSAQDNILGPASVAAAAENQLQVLQHLARTAAGRTRRALTAVSATFAEFAGWLADDLGNRREGEYWTDRALQWAHEADDEGMVGYILMRKAQRAIADNDPAAAVSLAQAAQRRGALSSRVRAAAAQQEALGHASLDDAMAFRSTIEHAGALIADAGAPLEGERGRWCTPSYVDMHEADGWMRLKDNRRPAEAVACYERGLANWPEAFRRDQGVYLARAASAYAANHQPDQAVDAAQRALTLASQTGSARAVSQLVPLTGALSPWGRTPQIKKLIGQLQVANRG